MSSSTVYRYIWDSSRRRQIYLMLLTALVVPLSMAPLELQRRIVDRITGADGLHIILGLCLIYLLVVLVQGGLKYWLNLTRGMIVENVTRALRQQVCIRLVQTAQAGGYELSDRGTAVSIVAAETEEVGGFAAEALSTPLLQGGTTLAVLGYLLWVEPLIAGLAVLLYIPQAIIVPRVQRVINDYARQHAILVRHLGDDIVRLDVRSAERPGLLADLQNAIRRAYDTRVAVYRRKFLLTFLGNFLDALGPLMVLAVGGYLVLRHQAELSTLVVFISGFQKLADPWDQLINYYRTASNAQIKYRLIVDTIAGMPSPQAV